MKKPLYKLLIRVTNYSCMGILGQFLLVGLSLAHDADPLKTTSRHAIEAVNATALMADEKGEAPVNIINAAINVSGKVTSSSDEEGIPGVNIMVKGTLTGTVTDVKGSYNLTVPNENDTLVFSSIGYKTQEVVVNGRTVIDIIMEEDLQLLAL
jgi:hypothetical protein